ncbi:ATP-binding protein [Myxococcota bacterium]|nr:ATP-binding protein [Myxococcota bacterium]
MSPRRGLQAEILVSLLFVMLTAAGVLGSLMVYTHAERVRQLAPLSSKLLAEVAEVEIEFVPGQRWWRVDGEGRVSPRGGHAQALDSLSRVLAAKVRQRGRPVLESGAPWEPVRFATPLPSHDDVAVSVIPAVAPGSVMLGIVLGDVLVVAVLGGYLLRRRVVRPLQTLAAATREVSRGGLGAHVAMEGVTETAEVARAFNEMTDALRTRSEELEKAVVDLRESNQDLREARDGLDRAARLTAVGHLAAGVAHEVGNPIGAMLALLDLVERDPGLSSQSRDHVERAAREGARVRGILTQLLDFSAPARGPMQAVDVCALAGEAAELVRVQRRFSGIEITVEAETGNERAMADPRAVSQILLNLLLNAAEALEDPPSGGQVRVLIRHAARRLRSGDGRDAPAIEREDWDAVECRIRDDGPGVRECDQERIFDPFFTTKDPGRGTGLGLANAARLSDEFGGSLKLVRKPLPGERGAEFILTLPSWRTGRKPESRGRLRRV